MILFIRCKLSLINSEIIQTKIAHKRNMDYYIENIVGFPKKYLLISEKVLRLLHFYPLFVLNCINLCITI